MHGRRHDEISLGRMPSFSRSSAWITGTVHSTNPKFSRGGFSYESCPPPKSSACCRAWPVALQRFQPKLIQLPRMDMLDQRFHVVVVDMGEFHDV